MQGRVFLIKENQTNIYLAAKIYETNDGEAIALIKNEAKILSLLTHPNIIQFKKFYCLENEGLFIIITEYFPSISLETHITLQDLSTIQRTSIVKMIVDVVAYLQENDITHGDFNLSNILINPETSQIKIIDFGLSKHRIFAVEFLSPKGFFFYRPPLQLQIFYQSDIYDVWGLMLVLMGVFLGRKICSNSLMKSFQELEEKSELNDHILWIIQCVRRMLSDQNTVEMMKQSFCQLKEYI